MSTAVIGATGRVGSEVVRGLLARGDAVAALASRDTADDQPDNKQHRSDMHLDLRQRRRQLPWSPSVRKPTHKCGQCPFQKSGSQAGREIRQGLP